MLMELETGGNIRSCCFCTSPLLWLDYLFNHLCIELNCLFANYAQVLATCTTVAANFLVQPVMLHISLVRILILPWAPSGPNLTGTLLLTSSPPPAPPVPPPPLNWSFTCRNMSTSTHIEVVSSFLIAYSAALDIMAMIGPSDQSCWLAKACKILLLQIQIQTQSATDSVCDKFSIAL